MDKEKAFDTDEQEVPVEEVPEEFVQETDLADEPDMDTETVILKQQLADINDKYVRLSAEFDNYRKRTLKEKSDMIKCAGEDVLIKILPVVDNFERALASMEQSNDVEAVRKGIELIYSNFKDFLTQNGIQEIDCSGGEFNIDEQEAITRIPVEDKNMKGKVVDCVQKGYILNGKVIRFAKVVIGE